MKNDVLIKSEIGKEIDSLRSIDEMVFAVDYSKFTLKELTKHRQDVNRRHKKHEENRIALGKMAKKHVEDAYAEATGYGNERALQIVGEIDKKKKKMEAELQDLFNEKAKVYASEHYPDVVLPVLRWKTSTSDDDIADTVEQWVYDNREVEPEEVVVEENVSIEIPAQSLVVPSGRRISTIRSLRNLGIRIGGNR